MLKNNKERRQWIDDFDNKYSIIVDTGSVRVLQSYRLPDDSRIIIIQVYTARGIYDYDKGEYVSKNEWMVVERYIKYANERTLLRASPSVLVEHIKGIKS